MIADNQQERPRESLSFYIAGFVDGEGSFHVAVQKSKNVRLGWQVIPEFHVSQNRERTVTLEIIQKVLDCGYIKPNHRTKATDRTNVLVVRNHQDLKEKVIPFFRRYKLLSSKNDDFEKFAGIVESMDRGKHLELEGLRRILEIAFSMNASGRYRKRSLNQIVDSLVSSETIRQARCNKDGKI